MSVIKINVFFDILDRVIATVLATSIKITVCTKMTTAPLFMIKDEKQEMLPTSSVTCDIRLCRIMLK